MVGVTARHGIFVRFILVLAALVPVGCVSDVSVREGRPDSEKGISREVFVAGRSVEGRPVSCIVLGGGADVCMFIATIHGDEPAGTPLLKRIEQHLVAHPWLLVGRRLVLVPVANPDGYADNRRNNVNGVDINRNFPAENFRGSRRHGARPLSEPESGILHDLVRRYKPDRIVSIHQPVACIDWDGPGRDLAEAMSRLSDLEAKRIGSLPGSLGSWVGVDLGRPIITLELPPFADDLDVRVLWGRYGPMLLQALIWPGRLEPRDVIEGRW